MAWIIEEKKSVVSPKTVAKEDFRYIPKTAGTQKNPDSSKTDFKVTKPKGTFHWNVSYIMTLKGKKSVS